MEVKVADSFQVVMTEVVVVTAKEAAKLEEVK